MMRATPTAAAPRPRALLAALATLSACSSAPDSPDAAVPAPRRVEATLEISANGLTAPLDFEIPDDARTVTVIASGDTAELLALASFVTADGVERVGIDLDGSHADAMRAQYFDEQIGQMPGDLYQGIRLGTFTHVYPYAPGQRAEPGAARLRIATTATGGTVDVLVVMPEDDEARALHVNVLSVSNTVAFATPPPFLDDAQTVFDQAGIEIIVDEVLSVTDSGLSSITDFSEPQEAPGSQSARLAELGHGLVQSDALNVYVVDSLPFTVGGLSLGTPGPTDPDSYYYGVILRHVSDDQQLARVFAHEVAHFVALQHVSNRGVSGTVYPDPLDDTEPGQGNLMENGTTLTPGQTFALTRSALLTTE